MTNADPIVIRIAVVDDHPIFRSGMRSEKISGYLLGNLLERVIRLVAGKSNRHINRAYVAADHLCGMRQMTSACLIANADYLGTSGGT